MLEPNSRYASLKTKSLMITEPDGQLRFVRYVERRFLPEMGTGTTLLEHRVVQGDRLENVTAKYLADPTQFWRVADSNEAMQPEELTSEIGGRIIINMPQ